MREPWGRVRAYSMTVVVLPDPATALMRMLPVDARMAVCSGVRDGGVSASFKKLGLGESSKALLGRMGVVILILFGLLIYRTDVNQPVGKIRRKWDGEREKKRKW